ncbi:CPBP family intramembrane glutamic endopeptidase [Pseudomonas indica]|uniref:CPBP family intramembrane glutamic endopeptidase n=1 Tax=Pseudomonas indica TaxID=137658 RepID=UPI000BAB4687|nr:CPBP family intramembrane glutamic endopeptidase [Pseudomonas indica]PAU64004.1 CAAX protease family protein [Pseudomonas indica]
MPVHLRFLLPLAVLASGFPLGFIAPQGVAIGILFIALVLVGERYLPRPIWWSLSLSASVALASHLLPGFSPWPLTAPRSFSPDAPPYAVRLGWDKLLVGLTLLAWWLGQPKPHSENLRLGYGAMAATLLAVPLLALALGLVGWQPKWPDELPVWLAVNLGVTVLMEELLFRAWLQRSLIARFGEWPGLLLGGVLFGAVHLPFSPPFALVAGVAGLGYGLAFHATGRLSVTVLLHGAVNLSHLLLLSYPLRLA